MTSDLYEHNSIRVNTYTYKCRKNRVVPLAPLPTLCLLPGLPPPAHSRSFPSNFPADPDNFQSTQGANCRVCLPLPRVESRGWREGREVTFLITDSVPPCFPSPASHPAWALNISNYINQELAGDGPAMPTRKQISAINASSASGPRGGPF